MPQKLSLEVTVRLIVELDDGVEVDAFVSDLDYDFVSQTDGARIHDTEIVEHTATASH